MGWLDRVRGRNGDDGERSVSYLPMSLDDYATYFTYQQNLYGAALTQTMPGVKGEQIGGNFRSLAEHAYKRNGVVYACMAVRMSLFSEARFQFRQLRNGQPGDLFGSTELAPLETPWAGATTGDLLTRAIQDVDLAGNFFAARRPAVGGQPAKIKRLRPDWVSIILGSMSDPEVVAYDVDAEVLGYAYQPGGPGSGEDVELYLAAEVAHFAPKPDPTAFYRGMSWLTPVIREIIGDRAMTDHKIAFLENGATPNLVVKLDPQVRQQAAAEWIDRFNHAHSGVANAYRTIFLGGGADATVVGSNLEQMTFKDVQAAGEARIAAAAEVPAIIVGLTPGLDASTYSNYGQAVRRFADGTLRPLWRNMAGSMAQIINVPGGAELWYDDRDIAFLREDASDAANILHVNSQAIRQLVDSGFEWSSVVDAITSGDLRRLQHTGLMSVQLLPPGFHEKPTAIPPDKGGPPAAGNGNGSTPAAAGASGGRALDAEHAVRELVREVASALPAAQVHVHNEQQALELPPIEIPVTVEGARAPDVHVHPAAVTVEAAPVPDVRVEGTVVNVEAPAAPDVHVAPAEVRVEPQITVEAAVPAEVTVTPQIHVAAPAVTVEAAPAPDVRVDVAAAEVTVEPADVHVDAPVTVNVQEQKPRKLKVKRDEKGDLAGFEEDGKTIDVTRDDEGRLEGLEERATD